MFGRFNTAGSFRQTLNYCLEDKHLTQAQGGAAIYKDRAEILWYNQCFGNKQDLIRQFNEVAHGRPNMSLPVLHISLSLPTGEQYTKGFLAGLAADCARSLDFEKHQYVAILHKDTLQQHIHLVANRIGFDGHTVSDSYSYGRMADYCREAERRLGLRLEQNPRRYQTPEERQIPRHGQRLDKLSLHIQQALNQSLDYPQFEGNMQQRGYRVLKSPRGIAFMDEKNIVFKGSETGHSLRIIEKGLAMNVLRLQREQELKLQQEKEREREQQRHHHRRHSRGLSL